MDEKSMILEQERQEKAKKRKKYKKVKWIAGILVIVLLIGGVWYIGWGRQMLAAQEDNTVEIQVSTGQRVTYAKITAINGNEITYAIAEAMEVDIPEGSGESNRAEGSRGQRGEEGVGGRGQQGEEQQSGGFPMKGNATADGENAVEHSGEIPDMSQMVDRGDMLSSEMPDMSRMSERMEGMSSNFGGRGGMGGFGGNTGVQANTAASTESNVFTYGDSVYMVGEESVTTYIPVGTDVTTKLGTITTFSRLSAGDCIAVVTEEENDEQIIMAVYIIG